MPQTKVPSADQAAFDECREMIAECREVLRRIEAATIRTEEIQLFGFTLQYDQSGRCTNLKDVSIDPGLLNSRGRQVRWEPVEE